MGANTPETIKKVKALGAVRHMLKREDSHPRGTNGQEDYGGFLENCEFAIKREWKFSEARQFRLNKLYCIYVQGEDPATASQMKPLTGPIDSFDFGLVKGHKSSEGWRISIGGIIIGVPVTREYAHIIGPWLRSSLPAIERYYAVTNKEVEGVQEATAEQALEDTKTAEQITEI